MTLSNVMEKMTVIFSTVELASVKKALVQNANINFL